MWIYSLYDLVQPGTSALLSARDACLLDSKTPSGTSAGGMRRLSCDAEGEALNLAVKKATNKLLIAGGVLATVATVLGVRAYYRRK